MSSGYGLYLYGSSARGDALVDSDVDVLVVLGPDNTARHSDIELPQGAIPTGKKADLSFYKLNRLDGMFYDGHLFAWHLYKEAQFLNRGKDYLAALGKPAPYTSFQEDVTPLLRLLGSIKNSTLKSPECLIYEAGLAYVCVRNIAMCSSYYSPMGLTFSAYAPYLLTDSGNQFPLPRKRYELLRHARLSGTRGLNPLPIDITAFLLDVDLLEKWAQREVSRILGAEQP